MSDYYTMIRPADRKLWLFERRKRIMGSDAAPIAGIAKPEWGTAMTVFIEKSSKEEPDLSFPNDGAEWGTRKEPIVRTKFAEMHPDLHISIPGVTFYSKKWPFAGGNLDGLIHYDDGRDEILEVKTAGERMAHEWGEADDDIPKPYICQAQHYMAVTGFAVVRFAVLIGASDYREYRIERNDGLIANLMDIEAEFWDHVLRKDPPDPVTDEDVRLRWPTNSDAEREATQAECDMVFNLRQAQELAASATAQEKYLKTQLKIGMGALSALTLDGSPIVTWRKGKDQAGYSVPPRPGSRKFLVK